MSKLFVDALMHLIHFKDAYFNAAVSDERRQVADALNAILPEVPRVLPGDRIKLLCPSSCQYAVVQSLHITGHTINNRRSHMMVRYESFGLSKKLFLDDFKVTWELADSDSKLPRQVKSYRICDILDNWISHNEIVGIWVEKVSPEDKCVTYKEMVWHGMGWSIPEQYKNREVLRIFGTVVEHIHQSDTVNILIK